MAQTNIQTALLELNKRWLRQALDLLAPMDQAQFASSPAGFAPHRVCSHLRHVVEFYECFLDGLELASIDYDARKRDPGIEASPEAAAMRICSIIDRLDAAKELRADTILFVRAEDADALNLDDPYTMSSIARELMALSSHTLHHFALISMTLRAHGAAVDRHFGMAPSTLRYISSLRAMSALEVA